jgi:hypothetical protein
MKNFDHIPRIRQAIIELMGLIIIAIEWVIISITRAKG